MTYNERSWKAVICQSCGGNDFELLPDKENNKTHAITTSKGNYVGEVSMLQCKKCGEKYFTPAEIVETSSR